MMKLFQGGSDSSDGDTTTRDSSDGDSGQEETEKTEEKIAQGETLLKDFDSGDVTISNLGLFESLQSQMKGSSVENEHDSTGGALLEKPSVLLESTILDPRRSKLVQGSSVQNKNHENTAGVLVDKPSLLLDSKIHELVYLLYVGCSAKGLSDDFMKITEDFYNNEILPKSVLDIAKSTDIEETLGNVLQNQKACFPDSQLWNFNSISGAVDANSSSSRFESDFIIKGQLGYGSYGVVFKCEHKFDKKVYAVKRVPLEGTDKKPMEIEALSRLRHPHIVQYHQAWREGYVQTGCTPPPSPSELLAETDVSHKEKEHFYIQMQYCPKSLDEVWTGKPWDQKTAWKWFLQLVKGVEFMHKGGIFHCDLFSNNIFLDADDQIRIADFGIAQFLNLEKEKEESMAQVVKLEPEYIGNRTYRAPELLKNDSIITEKVDMYSIGVLVLDIFGSITRHEKMCAFKAMKDGKLPNSLKDEDADVQQMLLRLVNDSAHIRPSAEELLQVILARGKE